RDIGWCLPSLLRRVARGAAAPQPARAGGGGVRGRSRTPVRGSSQEHPPGASAERQDPEARTAAVRKEGRNAETTALGTAAGGLAAGAPASRRRSGVPGRRSAGDTGAGGEPFPRSAVPPAGDLGRTARSRYR